MLGLALLLLLAFPAAAGAGTASVQPYVEPPVDPFGSCSRYDMCPPDMLVFEAAAGEGNVVSITEELLPWTGKRRFLVRDDGAPVQAGPGCEQVEPGAVACTAATAGPLRLGDGNDSLTATQGRTSGGPGRDLLSVTFGPTNGDAGDDVIYGNTAGGGAGDDHLVATDAEGGPGDDVLRCPAESRCGLFGGAGDDRLTGGDDKDRLFGYAGDDIMQGGGRFDILLGNRGDDRLAGGAGKDRVQGGHGADRLFSRRDRVLDRVICGPGGGDLAVVDRRDVVERCERVLLPRP